MALPGRTDGEGEFLWKDSQSYVATRDPALPPDVGRLRTRFIHADETRFRFEWETAALPITVAVDGIVLATFDASGTASSTLPSWVDDQEIDVLYPGRLEPGAAVEWYRDGAGDLPLQGFVYGHEVSADRTATQTFFSASGRFLIKVPVAGIDASFPERVAGVEFELGEAGVALMGTADVSVSGYIVHGSRWKLHEEVEDD